MGGGFVFEGLVLFFQAGCELELLAAGFPMKKMGVVGLHGTYADMCYVALDMLTVSEVDCMAQGEFSCRTNQCGSLPET